MSVQVENLEKNMAKLTIEVSAEELVNYEIWGEFWTCNNAPIEGEWQVTFPVEKNE